jgi:hypothetical protein
MLNRAAAGPTRLLQQAPLPRPSPIQEARRGPSPFPVGAAPRHAPATPAAPVEAAARTAPRATPGARAACLRPPPSARAGAPRGAPGESAPRRARPRAHVHHQKPTPAPAPLARSALAPGRAAGARERGQPQFVQPPKTLGLAPACGAALLPAHESARVYQAGPLMCPTCLGAARCSRPRPAIRGAMPTPAIGALGRLVKRAAPIVFFSPPAGRSSSS